MSDILEDLRKGLEPLLKHPAGGHDDKSHGNWARRKGDMFVSQEGHRQRALPQYRGGNTDGKPKKEYRRWDAFERAGKNLGKKTQNMYGHDGSLLGKIKMDLVNGTYSVLPTEGNAQQARRMAAKVYDKEYQNAGHGIKNARLRIAAKKRGGQ